MTITHASLFSGIGGAEIASTWMGWRNMFHCEIQDFPRRVLEYWYPNSVNYEDITKTDFKRWKGTINVLTGGFPCQPFSLAGKRKGAEDNRYLWPEMLRAIREIQPDWVVGENVAGLISMVQPVKEIKVGCSNSLFEENNIYRREQRFTFEEICESLESERYSVQPFVIPACAVGAPHRRDRVWIVARRITPDRTDARIEAMQQKQQDGIFPAEFTPYTENPGRKRKYISGQKQREFIGRDMQNVLTSAHECWRNFPTQSPVCIRDDGISPGLSDITFPKWRSEAIKALGNAWVPQVAYEIFRAIEQTIKKL